MKLIITRKHVIGADYSSCSDCAASRAFKEQYPQYIYSHMCWDKFYLKQKNECGFIQLTADRDFNCRHFLKLKNGEIDSFEMNIQFPEHDAQQMLNSEQKAEVCDATKADSSNEASKIKEIIRYVSVPTSITEQSKELILS